jgi:post-segregation antitoxin (ccd killing protein)
MKMTIYLPDDLAEKVKGHEDLNVSSICQAALRAELNHREALANLGDGMERVELYDEGHGRDVAFYGKSVAYEQHTEQEAYLTKRKRIAVVDPNHLGLHDFDTFEEFAEEYSEMPRFVSDVAAAIGKPHVTLLDI